MKKYLVLLIVASFVMFSCNKAEEIAPEPNRSSQIAVMPENGKVEIACFENNVVGTRCAVGKGYCIVLNGCKEMIPPSYQGTPTVEEINVFSHEHATWMVQHQFYLPEHYEITREIGEQIMLNHYYP